MSSVQEEIEKRQAVLPVSYVAAAFMVGIWLVAATPLVWWLVCGG
jgi:hypothetical protein